MKLRGLLQAVLGMALLLGAAVAAAPPGSANIYYYDPAIATTATPSLDGRLNAVFQKVGAGITLKTFTGLADLKKAIGKAAPQFLVLPPYLQDQLGTGATLKPMLIRERDGSSSYEIVLVGPGKLAELKGKTIAAAGDAAQPGFLDGILLKGTGLTAKDVRVLQVSKDIDGVMAAGQGQAAGAAALPGSVALVKRANPSVAEKLNEIHKVSAIPLAMLFAYGEQDPATVEAVRKAFLGLDQSPHGKRALSLLKTDDWREPK